MTEPSDPLDLSKKSTSSSDDSASSDAATQYAPTTGPTPPEYGSYPAPPQGAYTPPPSYAPPPDAYPPGGYQPQFGGYPPQSGFPAPGFGPGYGAAPVVKNGIGVAALVVAIAALFLFWTVFGGFLLGTVAIILGVIGMVRAKRGEANNRGVAISGVVLGVLAIIASAAFIVIGALFIWNTTGIDDYYDCVTQAGNDQAEVEQCASDFATTIESRFNTTIDRPTP